MPGEIGSSSRLAQAPTRAARMKTVVVLGASYGGISAVRVLTQTLPKDWRIILIDRNSHANHLYVFPRFAVVSGHEHKAFIPLTGVFGPQPHPHRFIHGTVTGLSAHSVTVAPALPDEHTGLHDDVQEDVAGPSCVAFDYAIYALGSKLPAPIDLWSKPEDPEHKASEHDNDEDVIVPARKIGTKVEGVSWLQASQERIAKAPSVLVVGGGALGIQFASDIKSRHPRTEVTLLHSRDKLLNRFDPFLGREAYTALVSLGIRVLLSTRLDLSSLSHATKVGEPRTARTMDGQELAASLVLLCTGQTPNTVLMTDFLPDSIVTEGESKGKIYVKRTTQVAVPVRQKQGEARNVDSMDDLVEKTTSLDLAADAEEAPLQDAQPAPVDKQVAATGDATISAAVNEVEDDAHLTVPFPNIFAVGDCADAFGAINAGHTAYYQAHVAAQNISSLIQAEEARKELKTLLSHGCTSDAEAARIVELEKMVDPVLARYAPGAPAIKVSLGIGAAAWDLGGVVDHQLSGVPEDLDVGVMWPAWGQPDVTEEGMFA